MAKFLINAASIFSSGNELYIEIAEADSGSYDEFSIAVGASGNLRFVRTEFPTIYRATICSDSNPVAEVRDSVVVVVTGAFSDERVTHCRPPVDALSIGGVVREVPAPGPVESGTPTSHTHRAAAPGSCPHLVALATPRNLADRSGALPPLPLPRESTAGRQELDQDESSGPERGPK